MSNFDRIANPFALDDSHAEQTFTLLNSLVDTVSFTGLLGSGCEEMIVNWVGRITQSGQAEMTAQLAWEMVNLVSYYGGDDGYQFPMEEPSQDCDCPINHVVQAMAFNTMLEAATVRDNTTGVTAFNRYVASFAEHVSPDHELYRQLTDIPLDEQRVYTMASWVGTLCAQFGRLRWGLSTEMPVLGGDAGPGAS